MEAHKEKLEGVMSKLKMRLPPAAAQKLVHFDSYGVRSPPACSLQQHAAPSPRCLQLLRELACVLLSRSASATWRMLT